MPATADAIVLFGATGDLARRMLLPSLYFLDSDGFLPADLRIVCTARQALTTDAFLEQTKANLAERPEGLDEQVWARFAPRIAYCHADATTVEGVSELEKALDGAKAPL